MKRPFLLTRLAIRLALAFALTTCTIGVSAQSPDGYRIVAYVMGRGSDLSQIRADELTHINYAFASIVDGEIAFRFWRPEFKERIRRNISTLTNLKKENPALKVMISVGGWGNCAGFSDAALTPESREKLAKSAVRFMDDYGFDGVDLDWEYPGQVGGGEVFRPEDKENFTRMIEALRKEFDRQQKKYLLTIASGSDEEYFKWTDLGEAAKYLDFINVMAYDFYSGLSQVSGHHSNLAGSDMPGAGESSMIAAIDRHLKAGVPAGKLVIGVPFYGRYWRGVPDIDNGLYQKGNTTGQYKVYTDILDKYLNKNTFKRFWDISAKAPYLYSKDSSMIITYDDPESLKLKTDYIKEHHLGGIMFWEYFGDRSGQLLDAIYSGLRQRP